MRSGSTTTHANYSLPEYDSFHFDNPSFPRPPSEPPDVKICLHFEPDAPVIDNFDVLNNDEPFDPGEGENVVFLNVEEDDSFTFTILTFLPFVTYPEVSLLSCSTRSEDTIFDPDWNLHLEPVVFHLLPHGQLNSGSSQARDSVNKNKHFYLLIYFLTTN
ncbi:hypothetical protein Tco_0249273 [Tanacetum coccineum]